MLNVDRTVAAMKTQHPQKPSFEPPRGSRSRDRKCHRTAVEIKVTETLSFSLPCSVLSMLLCTGTGCTTHNTPWSRECITPPADQGVRSAGGSVMRESNMCCCCCCCCCTPACPRLHPAAFLAHLPDTTQSAHATGRILSTNPIHEIHVRACAPDFINSTPHFLPASTSKGTQQIRV